MLVTPINNRMTEIKIQSFRSKQISESMTSVSTLPGFADAKSFVNISFRGKAELHDAIERDDVEDVEKELRRVSINTKFGGDDFDDDYRTPLMQAVWEGSFDVFKYLLTVPGLDVNAVDKDNWTVLHYICDNNTEMEEYFDELLQERGDIDINIQSVKGTTPIMQACSGNNIYIIEKLLKHPDINLILKNDKGYTALDIANDVLADDKLCAKIRKMTKYQEEYPESIGKRTKNLAINIDKLSPEENIWTEEQITDKFKKMVNEQNYADAEKMLERTPLIDLSGNNEAALKIVCKTGNPDFVRKVFEYERNQEEMRTQYEARRKEFMDNMQKMSYEDLKNNNIALKTIDGFKILLDKQEFNPNDVVDKNMSMSNDTTTLFDIACGLDNDLAQQILSKYEDVDVKRQKKSNSKVLKAAIKDYETVGKYKLKLDNLKLAIINPTSMTREEATKNLIGFISSPEFKPEMTDTVGNSALHIISGISTGNIRGLIQKLLDKGIDINSKNIAGQNCIMSAIKALRVAQNEAEKENILSNIKFLIDKGVNIEDVDKNGQTVFHYVCTTASVALMMLILKKEPNIFVRDLRGNRPQVYLKDERMKEIYNKYINGNGII